MVLSPENLVYYLLERGYVTRQSVVNGGIEICEIARRNRNFRVAQAKGQGYFLKQVRRWEPEAIRTLRTEAQCYKLIGEIETFSDLAPVTPRFLSYDERRAVLVTELLDSAETVTEHHFRNEAFPVEVGEQLGRAFGKYHRKASVNTLTDFDGVFQRRPAWALSLHQISPETGANLSGGICQMLAMMRQFPQFATILEKLSAEWHIDALIHGDIKWENCVLCADLSGATCLKIVDWEMADLGDSCWDVGAIFSAYLSFWVQSLPLDGQANPNMLAAQARFPLERMQPAIRGFWVTYMRFRDISGQAERELLRRTVMYTGARTLQTAFEFLQSASAANPITVLLLQLSMNVLTDPEGAAGELLGIEL